MVIMILRVLLEVNLPVFQRGPVGRTGIEFPEVWPRNVQDALVGEIVREAETFLRVLYHPHHGSDYPQSDLDSGCILAGSKGFCFLNREDAAGPPGIIGMTHKETPKISDPEIISRSLSIRNFGCSS